MMILGMEEHHLTVFACVGLAVVATRVLGAFLGLYKAFLRPGKNLRKYGSWAVVTGATDGIGKAYAEELARRGLNVLLISRTESKLKECVAEIGSKYPKVTLAHLAIDYSSLDAKAHDKIAAALKDKDVGILVNNVGMSYDFPEYMHSLSEADMDLLIEMNVKSVVSMTQLVLPGMVERKRGAIVNMASGAALRPTPLLAGYAGVKGLVMKLSESLNVELAPKNVHVQCQTPHLVATKLSKIRRAKWDVPSPKTYVRWAVRSIGYEGVVSPYWGHRVLNFVMDALPSFLVNKVVYGMHLGIRKRALNKKANASKAK